MDASADQVLIRSDAGGICTLTLNRPRQRNALSMELMAGVIRELGVLAGDDSIRAVVITGSGPAFCSGHDLREMRSDPSERFAGEVFARCSTMMQKIVALPQPVIAKVNGFAFAAGCQLVATCDLAIAADTATFSTPGVNIGLFCSTPMVALSRNAGRKQAMEMLLLGQPIDAERAQGYGLINRAVPASDLDAAVDEWAAIIAGKAQSTVRIGKSAFYRQLELGLADAYEFASAVMTRNMMEDDAAEGIDAFLQKRAPRWTS
jgi:enoyl-CoA hydratase/carnithine racemase